MERTGTYAPADPATVDVNPVMIPSQVAVGLDELHRMRADVIAIKATVEHLLEVLAALTATAQTPADRT